MRTINKLIIHCTATLPGQRVSIADITRWHQARGFRTIGYHYVIQPDGTIQQGRPIEEVGAHCQGHNANAIGICYVGGCVRSQRIMDKGASAHSGGSIPSDTRTEAQKAALRKLLQELLTQFPNATIHGHNEFAAKACPCFDARAEYQDLQ